MFRVIPRWLSSFLWIPAYGENDVGGGLPSFLWIPAAPVSIKVGGNPVILSLSITRHPAFTPTRHCLACSGQSRY